METALIQTIDPTVHDKLFAFVVKRLVIN